MPANCCSFTKKSRPNFKTKLNVIWRSQPVFYVPERSTTNCGPSESQRFTREEPWEPFRDGPHRWDPRRERRTRITRWGTGRSWRCRTGSCRLEWGACTRLPPNWAPNWKEVLKKDMLKEPLLTRGSHDYGAFRRTCFWWASTPDLPQNRSRPAAPRGSDCSGCSWTPRIFLGKTVMFHA